MAPLSWDEVGQEEEVSAKEAKAIESGGKPPVGKYLCTCIESWAEQNNMNKYSCIVAVLQWQIDKAVEIEGREPTAEEAEAWAGKIIWDRVNQKHPKEKDGMKNRRQLIAKRVGLLGPEGGKLDKDSWGPTIIGKRAVIKFIDESWEDKVTKEIKKSRKVAPFDGYDYADQVSTTVNEDDFKDI